MGRSVALKELLRPSARAEARFVREATITARLEHPSIVPVHDAGSWPGGELFYTMKLVAGRSLREVIQEKRTLAQRIALLSNVLAVADAVAYAHSKRIIHRDLKPANIIVGEYGETVVIDWGLAKDLTAALDSAEPNAGPYRSAASDDVTVHGEVVGTPAYMSPEQAAGEPVDETADVYALGAILYEVLSGSRPFSHLRSKEPTELLEVVRTQPPEDVTAVSKETLPDELVTIVRRAMAREPSERYPTAAELAADLRRYQSGQLVASHRYSAAQLVARWIGRHRIVVTAALTAIVAAVSVGTFSFNRIARERDAADRRKNALTLLHARNSLLTDPTSALAWLKEYEGDDWGAARSIASEAQARGVARHVLRAHADGIKKIAAVPERAAFVSASTDHTLRLWSAETGEQRVLFSDLPESPHVAVAPDGSWIAHDDREGAVWLRALQGSEEVQLSGWRGPLREIVFMDNGRLLAVHGTARETVVWELEGAMPPQQLAVPPLNARVFRPIPGSSKVVYARRAEVRLRDLRTNQDTLLIEDVFADDLVVSDGGGWLATATQQGLLVAAIDGHDRYLAISDDMTESVLALSADGRFVVACRPEGKWQVWDTVDRRHIFSGETDADLHDCHLSADGEVLHYVYGESLARMRLDEEDDRAELTFSGHSSRILSNAIVAGGELVSGDASGEIRIWREPPPAVQAVLKPSARSVFTVATSSDGQYVAADGSDGWAYVWSLGTATELARLPHPGGVFGVAFSADNRSLATGSHTGEVRVWSLESSEPATLHRHQGLVRNIAFSPRGRKLASVGADGVVRVWDTERQASLELLGHTDEVYWASFSDDERLLATGAADGTVRVWDLEQGAVQVLRGHRGLVYRVAFVSPTALLSGSWDGTVRLWSLDAESSRVVVRHGGPVRHLVYARDSRLLLSASESGVLSIYSFEDNSERTIQAHAGRIAHFAASSDGRFVATGGHDSTIRVFDLESQREIFLVGHHNAVQYLSLSGDMLVSGGLDGLVRVWQIDFSEAPSRVPRDLSAWLASKTSAVIEKSTGRAESANLVASPLPGNINQGV